MCSLSKRFSYDEGPLSWFTDLLDLEQKKRESSKSEPRNVNDATKSAQPKLKLSYSAAVSKGLKQTNGGQRNVDNKKYQPFSSSRNPQNTKDNVWLPMPTSKCTESNQHVTSTGQSLENKSYTWRDGFLNSSPLQNADSSVPKPKSIKNKTVPDLKVSHSNTLNAECTVSDGITESVNSVMQSMKPKNSSKKKKKKKLLVNEKSIIENDQINNVDEILNNKANVSTVKCSLKINNNFVKTRCSNSYHQKEQSSFVDFCEQTSPRNDKEEKESCDKVAAKKYFQINQKQCFSKSSNAKKTKAIPNINQYYLPNFLQFPEQWHSLYSDCTDFIVNYAYVIKNALFSLWSSVQPTVFAMGSAVMCIIGVTFELVSELVHLLWHRKSFVFEKLTSTLSILYTAMNYSKNLWPKLSKLIWKTQTSNSQNEDDGLSNISLPTSGKQAVEYLFHYKDMGPYRILGLPFTASDDLIKKHYKKLAVLVHPDKNQCPGAEDAFKILTSAFDILGDTDKRKEYDFTHPTLDRNMLKKMAEFWEKSKEELEKVWHTMKCSYCGGTHMRYKTNRSSLEARYCKECGIRHKVKEGDLWAETSTLGFRWYFFCCMDGAVFDVTEWVACQRDLLSCIKAESHEVTVRLAHRCPKFPNCKHSKQRNCWHSPSLVDLLNEVSTLSEEEKFTSVQQQNSNSAAKAKGKRKKR